MQRNNALAKALRYVVEHAPETVAPDDRSLAQTPDDSEWSYDEADRVYRHLTTRYARTLIDGGWEPDFLPEPVPAEIPGQQDLFSALPAPPTGTPAPSPSAPQNVPANPPSAAMPALTLDGTVAVLSSPEGHPIREGARLIPGAKWDGVSAWRIPITPRSAPAVMDYVRSVMPVTVTPDVREALKTAAQAEPAVNVSVTATHFQIAVEYTPEIQEDIKRAGGRWNGEVWLVPLGNARRVLKLANRHELRLDPISSRAAFALDDLAGNVLRLWSGAS